MGIPMIHHTPCYCGYQNKCFRCAVGYVIRRLGGIEECDCVQRRVPFCEKCEGRLAKDFEHAVQLAKTETLDRAKARSQESGMVGRTLNESVFFTQDICRAAEELLSEVENDPVSYDAALCFVATRIEKGESIPVSIRSWAASAIRGEAKRPKALGKYKGATLERDKIILEIIDTLVDDLGLHPSSGDGENGQSACHAVRQGLWLLRQEPDSYSSILRIWKNRKNLRLVSVPSRS